MWTQTSSSLLAGLCGHVVSLDMRLYSIMSLFMPASIWVPVIIILAGSYHATETEVTCTCINTGLMDHLAQTLLH